MATYWWPSSSSFDIAPVTQLFLRSPFYTNGSQIRWNTSSDSFIGETLSLNLQCVCLTVSRDSWNAIIYQFCCCQCESWSLHQYCLCNSLWRGSSSGKYHQKCKRVTSAAVNILAILRKRGQGDLVITGSPATGRCHQRLIQHNTLIGNLPNGAPKF